MSVNDPLPTNCPSPPTCCKCKPAPAQRDRTKVLPAMSHSSKSPSPLPPCVFSCRIVQIDYYLAPPLKDLDVCFSYFRSSPVEKVPILRVFGATPGGQKTCVHIHGSFPYLLVPCLVADPSDSYLHQLARSIDHALQVSLGASSRSVNHVFKIVVVKGMYVGDVLSRECT